MFRSFFVNTKLAVWDIRSFIVRCVPSEKTNGTVVRIFTVDAVARSDFTCEFVVVFHDFECDAIVVYCDGISVIGVAFGFAGG